ncbi:hypothetical protein AgCh_039311 [Apium graveolens]
MSAKCLAPNPPITKKNKAYRGQIKAQIFESLGLALVSMASKAGEVITYKVKVEAGGAGGNGATGGGAAEGGGGGINNDKEGDGSD